MSRAEKVAILHRILAGQTGELKQLRASRGRPYADDERAAQKAYMATWSGQEPTDTQIANFWGSHDQSGQPGATTYRLPNGMMICF